MSLAYYDPRHERVELLGRENRVYPGGEGAIGGAVGRPACVGCPVSASVEKQQTHLNNVALLKAQTGPVICIVIVERANVHASWRHGGTRIAVHSARG